MALVLAGGSPGLRAAEEFAAFALTGYEGHIAVNHVSDEYGTRQGGFGAAFTSRQRQSDLRVEAFLMTHSYLYHPNFIALDVGGGPILQTGRAENDAASTRSRQALYSFSARAKVLADKPYNGSLYYEHLNPTLLQSPGEIFNQETDEYGLSFALLAPVTPVPFTIDASRSHTSGSSAVRLVDDRAERVAFRASRALWSLGTVQLGYHDNRHDSSSGSPNLPLQRSRLRSRSLNVDAQLAFGADRQHQVFGTLLFTQQNYTIERGPSPRVDDSRLLLVYRGVVSRELHTSASYNHARNEQDGILSDTNSANAGLAWYPTSPLALTGGLHGDDTAAAQFTQRSWGLDGSARYEHALAPGTLRASYAVRYDQRDQIATAAAPTVVGERVVLSGTSTVPLARTNVTSGSVTVSNASRTQVFLEGIDYLLTVVGITTRIERVLAGNILDGEAVLMDYAFDVGGTFASTLLDQSLNFDFAPSSGLNFYLRYVQTDPRVTSGRPSSPLNTVHTVLYGARGEAPLGLRSELTVGATLEREVRRETIAPYTRTAGELQLRAEFPWEERIGLRAAARRTRVTADNSLQEVNLTGYDLTLTWRHGQGLHVAADARVERDTAGPRVRDRRTATLRALWRFRQLTLTADASRVRESQGEFAREQTAAHLNLRRDF